MKSKVLPSAVMYRNSVSNSFGLTRTLPEIAPCLDYDGQPISFCGAWAVVFKVRFCESSEDEDCRCYALKCYLKKGEASASNAAFLSTIDSPYIVHFQYLEDELYVYDHNEGASYFPVSIMEWVEGETLGHAIKRFCSPVNRRGDFDADYMACLAQLAANFDRFALWLLDQPFAHGDLKDDNILIDEELEIRVIDYDNIYVPGSESDTRLVFSPDYQHPRRTSESRGLWLDHYSLALISLSLHALVGQPELYSRLHRGDNILFDPQVITSSAKHKKLKTYQASQLAALDELRAAWSKSGQNAKLALIDAACSQNPQIEGLRDLFSELQA